MKLLILLSLFSSANLFASDNCTTLPERMCELVYCSYGNQVETDSYQIMLCGDSMNNGRILKSYFIKATGLIDAKYKFLTDPYLSNTNSSGERADAISTVECDN